MTIAEISETVSKETECEISWYDGWGGAYCLWVDDTDAAGGGYYPLYMPPTGDKKPHLCGENATLDNVRAAFKFTFGD